MATIDCSLDSLSIPAVSDSYDFGSKQSSGGLSTEDCVANALLPFSRQRPFNVTEASSTSNIQANSVFNITAGVTLTLSTPSFNGCVLLVVNSSTSTAAVNGTINGTSSYSISLPTKSAMMLVYNGASWLVMSFVNSSGGSFAPLSTSSPSTLANGHVWVSS